eukprot:scaffold156746_cov39-Tisochrysis_lutea.AAC.1
MPPCVHETSSPEHLLRHSTIWRLQWRVLFMDLGGLSPPGAQHMSWARQQTSAHAGLPENGETSGAV